MKSLRNKKIFISSRIYRGQKKSLYICIKFEMCWRKDLVKINWKLNFANNILLELGKITCHSITLLIPALFENESIQANINR